MNCEEYRGEMMDMLYGEQSDSRRCFDFFRHLQGCPDCNGDYLDLIETREVLGEWKVDELPLEKFEWERGSGRGPAWWPLLQKIAVAFLMAAGLLSIAQHLGFPGGRRMMVSEQQLTRLVHDMIVDQQLEERRLMLRAMLSVKEDLELEQRAGRDQLRVHLASLEQRYLANLEENNQYLKTLLNR